MEIVGVSAVGEWCNRPGCWVGWARLLRNSHDRTCRVGEGVGEMAVAAAKAVVGTVGREEVGVASM